MPKVILRCGKLCAGKTSYARRLMERSPAVLLSTDDLMLRMFPAPLGEQYDIVCGRAQRYLWERALDIVRVGADVIFEGMSWKRAERQAARVYFREWGIPVELHYLNVPDAQWQMNIARRNQEATQGSTNAYYADEGLLQKCLSLFESPGPEEVDVLVYESEV